MAAFVTVLICANLIGPAKISQVDLPVVGTLVFGAIGHRLSRRAVFFVGFAVVPATLAALALEPALPLTLAVLAGFGLGLGLANVLEYTIYFERIPEGMRARVLGLAGHGVIAEGAVADLTILDRELRVVRTFVGGAPAYVAAGS